MPEETEEKAIPTAEEEKKEKKKEKKGKKPHKNKPTGQKWKKYKIEAGKLIREKTCPRCGPGIFLMHGKNRLYCGKCHYTTFESKEKSKEINEK
jgi:small subunit ribosomal protein S27Ae